MCTTEGGESKCRVDYPKDPPHPITCMIENACITGPEKIQIYTNSTLHAAFDGVQLSTESLNEDRNNGLIRLPM